MQNENKGGVERRVRQKEGGSWGKEWGDESDVGKEGGVVGLVESDFIEKIFSG